VRSERIITKGRAVTHFFCGYCTHEWDAREPTPDKQPEKSERDSEN
jgi:hypothetical protein